jgi:hypothetical protein
MEESDHVDPKHPIANLASEVDPSRELQARGASDFATDAREIFPSTDGRSDNWRVILFEVTSVLDARSPWAAKIYPVSETAPGFRCWACAAAVKRHLTFA